MLKAQLGDEVVSHLTVMSSYNIRDPKEIHRLKVAGSNGELTCIDCGEQVRFRYGGKFKYLPHFSHRPGSVCRMESHSPYESDAHANCVDQLYFYFRDLEIPVEFDKYLECRRRANLYIGKYPDGVAVEVVVNPAGFKALNSKLMDYKRHSIKNLWILNTEDVTSFIDENESFIYPILENGDNNSLVVFNEKMDQLTLLKRTEFRDPDRQLISDTYISNSYSFQGIGYSLFENRFETDFDQFFIREEEKFFTSIRTEILRQEKEREERVAQRLLREKRDQEKREAEERFRLERQKEIEEKKQQDNYLRSEPLKPTYREQPERNSYNNTGVSCSYAVNMSKQFVELVITGRIGPQSILLFENRVRDRWRDYIELGYSYESMCNVVNEALENPRLCNQERACLKRIRKGLESKMGL